MIQLVSSLVSLNSFSQQVQEEVEKKDLCQRSSAKLRSALNLSLFYNLNQFFKQVTSLDRKKSE
jgi:hypothetical protein